MSARCEGGAYGVLAAIVLMAGCATPPAPEVRYDYSDGRDFAQLVKPQPSGGPALTNQFVTLSNRWGTARVSLIGANVVSYVPAGGTEVLLQPKEEDFTTGMFIHGGIPIVWPWFNMNGEAGTAPHGFARVLPWTVVEKVGDEGVSRLTLELVSTPETRRVWPYEFQLRYVITLSEQLQVSLVTRNVGRVPFSLTEGFHSYFRVSDVNQVVLRGLDGCLNDTLDSAKADLPFSGDLKFHAGEGRVFTPGRGEYVLFDEGANRALAVSARGHRKLTLWSVANPYNVFFRPGDWKHFCCLEPSILCRESAVTVAPGKEYELRMSVKAVPLR